jgi:hypothetical protein
MPEYRHTVGSTTPKTGPVPPAGVPLTPDIVEHDDRFGKAANRSVDRIKNYDSRRAARAAKRKEDEE